MPGRSRRETERDTANVKRKMGSISGGIVGEDVKRNLHTSICKSAANSVAKPARGDEENKPRPEGRGGRTITIACQGPQKIFPGSEEPGKFFCFPLTLHP